MTQREEKGLTMTQYAFYFDGTRCTGCKTCEFACTDYKDLNRGTTYRRVYEITSGKTTRDASGALSTTCVSYPVSLACNHCNKPICAEVCPTGAMHKSPDTGIVSVDASKCIGCGYCHLSCPYNAPSVDRKKGHSVKCDGCMERIAEGEKPVCVEACPARTLDFAPVEGIRSLGEQGAIAPLPDPKYTDPNIFINPSVDSKPSGSPDGMIANPLEVQ